MHPHRCMPFCVGSILKNFNLEHYTAFLCRKLFASAKFSAYLCNVKTQKEDNNKEEVKNLILKAAQKLFLERGIKDVKMDDIASFISVSKRTIYEQFGDKEQLIIESIKEMQRQTAKRAREIIRNSTDTFDIILKLYELYFELLRSTSAKFFSDLDKYPEVKNRSTARQKRNSKLFIAWMEEGRKQGLFREDADFNILSYILGRDLQLIMSVSKQKEQSELSNYTPEDLGRTLILFYLRGIATAKGREKIAEFIKGNKK